MTTETFTGTLLVQQCIQCGMAFGVPLEYDRRRREARVYIATPLGVARSVR